ncbi:hypothetical protein [Rhodoblastus sp.]|uniref:hypothetical protein n=1 Tax=Rhodoblastus sp. TaxID=1962975 RepID=UPI003F95CD9D
MAVDERHGLALYLIAENHGTHGLAARIEKALVEFGEERRRVTVAGRRSTAQSLKNFAIARAKCDAKARRHDRWRNSLHIGEPGGSAFEPVKLLVLQHDVPGDQIGDPVRSRPCGAVGLERHISSGGDETERGQEGDTQAKPKFKIEAKTFAVPAERKKGSGRGKTSRSRRLFTRNGRRFAWKGS